MIPSSSPLDYEGGRLPRARVQRPRWSFLGASVGRCISTTFLATFFCKPVTPRKSWCPPSLLRRCFFSLFVFSSIRILDVSHITFPPPPIMSSPPTKVELIFSSNSGPFLHTRLRSIPLSRPLEEAPFSSRSFLSRHLRTCVFSPNARSRSLYRLPYKSLRGVPSTFNIAMAPLLAFSAEAVRTFPFSLFPRRHRAPPAFSFDEQRLCPFPGNCSCAVGRGPLRRGECFGDSCAPAIVQSGSSPILPPGSDFAHAVYFAHKFSPPPPL